MPTSEVVRVFCLDVGQGDATVVIGPQPGRAILVDACRADAVVEILREHKVRRLSLALLSHSDHDHSAGFAAVLEEFIEGMSGRVDFVAIDLDRLQATGVWTRLLAKLRVLACPAGHLGARRFRLCAPTLDDAVTQHAMRRTRIARILYPSFEDLNYVARLKGMPNEGSAVLLLEWHGQRMLLGGDLGAIGWSALTRRTPDDLRADVFRFPHHGGRFIPAEINGKTISQQDLLEYVRPSTVIISVGTHNSYGHPDPGTVKLVCSRQGTRLLCTEATEMCLRRDEQDTTPLPRGPVACAGTVVVTLGCGPSPVVAPSEPEHRRVIDALANSRCRKRH